MPGAFYYPGPEESDLSKSDPPREQLEIGEIDESDIQRVHEVFLGLVIDCCESSGWNCQNWSLAGLEHLRSLRIVHDHMANDVARSWLKEA